MTEIRHTESTTNGEFTAWIDGKQAGEMTYLRQKGTLKDASRIMAKPTEETTVDLMVIDHTMVFDGFEGQGIARQMVMAAVEFARQNGRKIIPVCSYAVAVLTRTDEYTDILV